MTGAPILPVLAAAWLGILTSISPCPLATNVAAMSFIARRMGSVPAVVVSGLLYAAGRVTVYVAIGAMAVFGLLSVSPVSFFLQRYMHRLIGPVLLLAGVVLLEVVPLRLLSIGRGERARRTAERGGLAGAFLLGVVFALSFCPVSAALFFGSLVPLAVSERSAFLLPCVYGAGTGLPVAAFAVALAFGLRAVSSLFGAVTRAEVLVRRLTAAVFIAIGAWYSAVHSFRLFG